MISPGALEWFKDKASRFDAPPLFGESLARHTYYRIGGPAAVFCAPKTLADLALLAEGVEAFQLPWFILGLGSNILVSDEGYPGLVLKTSRLNLEIQLQSETVLETGASVAVSTLLRRAGQEGWGGLELLSGVPGSIGGVICMNAGTHQGEAKDRLLEVRTVSFAKEPALRTYGKDQFQFAYRSNQFLRSDELVVSARWRVDREEPAQVKSRIDEMLQRRKATQPVDYPSCGSVFKNPKAHGLHAWQVIEKLGLRGYRQGEAQFSEKHPNFIVNLGGARAQDVRDLIELARRRAAQELGISLEPEVKFLGAFHSTV